MTLTGSSQTFTIKYIIHTTFDIEGVVEKSDVIGAVFGQTEGLFGPDLDLRELQKSGRIGRIEIILNSKQDKTNGTITIPTSLDRVSTALIAASIESINRVGPCAASVALKKIEDIREGRRKIIIDRAKEILHKWTIESMPSVDEVFKEVANILKGTDVEKYGPEELAAGPELTTAKSIIIVEGRADVINLMRCGIYNIIAVEGAKIPETIKKLCKEKEITLFLDGDRGGDLILKEFQQIAKVKYVTRAPRGKEVEDLNCREIFHALENKQNIHPSKKPVKEKPKKEFPIEWNQISRKLEGTLEAILLNEKREEIERLQVSKLAERLKLIKNVHTVIFDGVITQRIIDIAMDKEIKAIIAARKSTSIKRPSKPINIRILTFSQILKKT